MKETTRVRFDAETLTAHNGRSSSSNRLRLPSAEGSRRPSLVEGDSLVKRSASEVSLRSGWMGGGPAGNYLERLTKRDRDQVHSLSMEGFGGSITRCASAVNSEWCAQARPDSLMAEVRGVRERLDTDASCVSCRSDPEEYTKPADFVEAEALSSPRRTSSTDLCDGVCLQGSARGSGDCTETHKVAKLFRENFCCR